MHPAAPRFSEPGPFALLLLTTGIIGWLASAQLVRERLALYQDADYITSCDVNAFVSCGEVFRTWQASVFGFPNPLMGIVAFAVIITTGAVVAAGGQLAPWYWRALQAGVLLGMVFTVWLWSQALFSIGILCIYCMVVWAAMIVLTVFVTSRNVAHGVLPAPAPVRRFLAEWTAPLTALVLIATAASVLFRFLGAFV
jgi:uncharacterized membrane protein